MSNNNYIPITDKHRDYLNKRFKWCKNQAGDVGDGWYNLLLLLMTNIDSELRKDKELEWELQQILQGGPNWRDQMTTGGAPGAAPGAEAGAGAPAANGAATPPAFGAPAAGGEAEVAPAAGGEAPAGGAEAAPAQAT